MSKKSYQPPDMYFESTKNFKKKTSPASKQKKTTTPPKKQKARSSLSTKSNVPIEVYENDSEEEGIHEVIEIVSDEEEVQYVFEDDSDVEDITREMEYTSTQKALVQKANKHSIQWYSSSDFKNIVIGSSFSNNNLQYINSHQILRYIIGFPTSQHQNKKKNGE